MPALSLLSMMWLVSLLSLHEEPATDPRNRGQPVSWPVANSNTLEHREIGSFGEILKTKLEYVSTL